MKLAAVLVTHNRWAYTERTLASFVETLTVPTFLVVVDNASTDGTVGRLRDRLANGAFDLLILNQNNEYPGKACNIGWTYALGRAPDATHLMRLDNDMDFSHGWVDRATEYFDAFPNLGQLGLDHWPLHEEGARQARFQHTRGGLTVNSWPGNVGGTHIMKRELWDHGLRYSEAPWRANGPDIPTAGEDAHLSNAIVRRGYRIGHMTDDLVRSFATPDRWSEYPDYYRKTLDERGLRALARTWLDEGA